MSRYRIPVLQELAEQQVRFAPREQQVRQVDRAEELLAGIDPDRLYPYEYLCFRITGFRPASHPQLVLAGQDVQNDLRRFIEDVSASAAIPREAAAERVWTAAEVCRRFQVSFKTVARWRQRGLVGRRFMIDGRKRLGFLESSIQRFVDGHAAQVQRGGRFTQLTDAEKEEIIRRARRMAEVCHTCQAEIIRRIARKMTRSTEAIRYTIKRYDQEHSDRAVFPSASAPLNDHSKQQIFHLYGRGMSVKTLARRFARTRSSMYRVINEVRARNILGHKLEWIDHPSFSDPQAEAEILAPTPQAAEPRGGRKPRAPKGLPPYLASMYEVPLLTREQEAHLFRKMNYLKYRAGKLRERLDPTRARAGVLAAIERFQNQALEVKNQIIRANLRLVVSIAKRHVSPTHNFFDLVSDGNMSLIRAVEKFDFSRGNKFSTYASWAIMKNFARTIPEENYRRDRYLTGHEEMFEAAADTRTDEHEYENAQRRMKEAVGKILNRLDDRSRDIIVARFGLGPGAEQQTLEQVGSRLGVTKERIRQLEARALRQLKQYADEERIDLPNL